MLDGLLQSGRDIDARQAGMAKKVVRNALLALKAFREGSHGSDLTEMGDVVQQPFLKQRGNYGLSESQITAEVVATSSQEMNKIKRNKRAEEDGEEDPVVSFIELAAPLLRDELFLKKAQENKDDVGRQDYPALRSGLDRNTKPRLAGISQHILGIHVAKSSSKPDRIDSIVAKVADALFPASRDPAFPLVEQRLSDFAVVTNGDGEIPEGTLVFLEANSLDSLGQPCTVECDHLVGWIIKDARVAVVEVAMKSLRWARLSERVKDIKDLRI